MNIKAEEAILELEQKWAEALLDGDAAALETIYADGMAYIHTDASEDNKDSYIAKIRTGAVVYDAIERDDILVRVFALTGVVTTHWQVCSHTATTIYETNARYVHVYSFLDDRWQMVVHQSTRIA